MVVSYVPPPPTDTQPKAREASVSAFELASASNIVVPTISLEPVNGIPQDLRGHITGTSLRVNKLNS